MAATDRRAALIRSIRPANIYYRPRFSVGLCVSVRLCVCVCVRGYVRDPAITMATISKPRPLSRD